jgi:nitrate/TMAO reductase-like tetraheme cytochrome c subunit
MQKRKKKRIQVAKLKITEFKKNESQECTNVFDQQPFSHGASCASAVLDKSGTLT